MQLDKEPGKWGRFFMAIYLCSNIAACYVTWAQHGFFAALGWLSAIVMILALVGADVVIGGQRKIIRELEEYCRGLIDENDIYVKQHKEAARVSSPAATETV